MDRIVEDVSSSDPSVVEAIKAPGSETQITLTGLSLGNAQVSVRGGDRTLIYDVNVSPRPERIYINIPESKRLTFAAPIDDVSSSVAGIVRLRTEADSLIVEAIREGKTTLTVTSGGQPYRYFVSTFNNRGADQLEIQNAFAAKNYKFLSVTFERDQATIAGTVPTQEELDDAVRIVKQYTPYVVVKAVVGALGVEYSESEAERALVAEIKRIAAIPGLIVKVKYPQPSETITTQFSRVIGAPVLQTSVTDNQTRLTTDTIQLPPSDVGEPGGTPERRATEGTIETIRRSQNLTVPEKIFLFGDVKDDLEEARAIRVARTYCPLIVSFLTAKDPIQVRFQIRFALVDMGKLKDVGFRWVGTGDGGTFGNFDLAYAISGGLGLPTLETLTYLFAVNATSAIRLLENNDIGKNLQESHVTLTNGQPGSFFSGESIPYVATISQTDTGTAFGVDFVNVGVRSLIVPLTFERASQFTGEQLSLVNNDGSTRIPNLGDVMALGGPVGTQGTAPFIDQSVKYVDENGLIGVDITTSVSTLLENVPFGSEAVGIFTAPRTSDRFTSNRTHLRDGQSLVVAGLFDDRFRKDVRSLPFLAQIPLFGWLFQNPVTTSDTSELFVIYTPQIVRMSDQDAIRVPRPKMPELNDFVNQETNVIPQVEPVMYPGKMQERPHVPQPRNLQRMDKAMMDMKSVAVAPSRDSKALGREMSEGSSPAPRSAPPLSETESSSPAPAPMFTSPAPSTPRPEATEPPVDTPAPAGDTPYSEKEQLPATLP
jgi:Flp pilus assembly secretin CpaC/osmotically-inducible protein OsmY